MKSKSLTILLGISLCLLSCGEKVETFDIHSDAQANYLVGDYNLFTKYANGKSELSKPLPITLEWEENFGKSKLEISKTEAFDETLVYETTANKYDIYNLEIGSKYFWKITSFDGKNATKVAKFCTNDIAPRNLNIEGLTNTRDLGGWKTTDGHSVKQGLIYRSSKLNEDESTTPLITAKGIYTLVNELKIKTEIDLRTVDDNENGGITKSALGDDVKYLSIPFKSGGNYLNLNKDNMVGFFDVLGDIDNYPIIFHCSIGTDRTGLLAFFMNALLGVSEEDLYKDYLFSNFGLINVTRTSSTIRGYISEINNSQGENLSKKAYNYLVSHNVKSDDIDSFINIMKK